MPEIPNQSFREWCAKLGEIVNEEFRLLHTPNFSFEITFDDSFFKSVRIQFALQTCCILSIFLQHCFQLSRTHYFYAVKCQFISRWAENRDKNPFHISLTSLSLLLIRRRKRRLTWTVLGMQSALMKRYTLFICNSDTPWPRRIIYLARSHWTLRVCACVLVFSAVSISLCLSLSVSSILT